MSQKSSKQKYNYNVSAVPPEVEYDGNFEKPLIIEGCLDPNEKWYANLNTWQRLNSHHTYSSVRRFVHFKPFRTMMKDHLDFILNTTYQHNEETFPEECDTIFQPITVGEIPLPKRNVNYERGKIALAAAAAELVKPAYLRKKHLEALSKSIAKKTLYKDHPLIIGGIKERVHPAYVKLMNSSHHSPQTNAGYVRQDRDGMVFYY